jgi:hypothetical protein
MASEPDFTGNFELSMVSPELVPQAQNIVWD